MKLKFFTLGIGLALQMLSVAYAQYRTDIVIENGAHTKKAIVTGINFLN